jgi:nucleoside-diphosphate-sugar epimerase
MKILVLGGTQYLGRQLVERLLTEGHEVTVATRGNRPTAFSRPITHFQIDRSHREDMLRLGGANYDVVFDNICFTPEQDSYSVEAFTNHDLRYVLTSSGSVYNAGSNLMESEFEPHNYEFSINSNRELSYDEGKRQAESVFAQTAPFSCTFARIPIVLGLDDHSGRLEFHVEHIAASKPFYLPNPEARVGFIRSDEAARFLQWLGTTGQLTGAVNGASDGTYSLAELIDLISAKTNGELLLAANETSGQYSPFGFSQDFYLNTDSAKSDGFEFLNLQQWLPELVDELITREVMA